MNCLVSLPICTINAPSWRNLHKMTMTLSCAYNRCIMVAWMRTVFHNITSWCCVCRVLCVFMKTLYFAALLLLLFFPTIWSNHILASLAVSFIVTSHRFRIHSNILDFLPSLVYIFHLFFCRRPPLVTTWDFWTKNWCM